jgi:hypothetical protein
VKAKAKTKAKKKRRRNVRECECITKVDRLLATQGEALITSLGGPDEQLIVATQRTATAWRTGKLTAHLACNYCPFCGRKYLRDGDG